MEKTLFVNMKRYYLVILIIILLLSMALYSTYAMFTSTVETDNIVNMDTNLDYVFDINGTQQLKVTKGSKLRFNAIVKNSMNGKISYGIYYKMISPTTIPENAIIAQVSDSGDITTKGQLDAGTSKTVPLVIKNLSEADMIVEIGVRTGYATDTQGVDDIIYNEGEVPITDVQTNEEAGSDTCNATTECTTECIDKIENDKRVEYCYCKTGKETEVVPMTSDEMLQHLGLTAKTGTPNFANTATTDEGIYSANDDYGKSYYFRGAVTNNYVKFANRYWRIIRINGDGSIRMIYDGTIAHNNGESSADRQIGTSGFNIPDDLNGRIGYMYGVLNTNIYEKEHENINDSTIKKIVDDWYKVNIENLGYSDKVADTIYCNDRSIDSGTGAGVAVTYYGTYSRLVNKKAPKLICIRQSDAFTVNDTTKGNGALIYPIGLITADEVAMAGGAHNKSNTSYYLNIGNYYWTMSPSYFSGREAIEFLINTVGTIGSSGVYNTNGVRPVISLKNIVEFTGTGTITDPFIPIS